MLSFARISHIYIQSHNTDVARLGLFSGFFCRAAGRRESKPKALALRKRETGPKEREETKRYPGITVLDSMSRGTLFQCSG